MASTLVFEELITVRFDGLAASGHSIDLGELSESLAGINRIVTSASNFAVAGRPGLRKSDRIVRVIAKEPKANCYSIQLAVQHLSQIPLFQDYGIEVLGGLAVSVITYIFANAANKREEMKHLSASLDTAIKALAASEQHAVSRSLETVERMAQQLHPAVRRAVQPIGTSASTLTVSAGTTAPLVVDEADKEAIVEGPSVTVDDEAVFTVVISELDMVTGGCRLTVQGEASDSRHEARVTDPVVGLPNNPYVEAMAEQRPLKVRAKATRKDGELDKLFISNSFVPRPNAPDFDLEG